MKGFLQFFSGTLNERKAELINQVRQYAFMILPERERWDWVPICEVVIDRLEGSRRSIKGNLFEEIVRRNLSKVFQKFDHIKVFYKETGEALEWNDEVCKALNNYVNSF